MEFEWDEEKAKVSATEPAAVEDDSSTLTAH